MTDLQIIFSVIIASAFVIGLFAGRGFRKEKES